MQWLLEQASELVPAVLMIGGFFLFCVFECWLTDRKGRRAHRDHT